MKGAPQENLEEAKKKLQILPYHRFCYVEKFKHTENKATVNSEYSNIFLFHSFDSISCLISI